MSAASTPARAVAASTAGRPRRARAVPGVTGRSDGHIITAMTPATITTAGHQAPPVMARRTAPGSPPAEWAGGSPEADMSTSAR